jgi:hypothetical protein
MNRHICSQGTRNQVGSNSSSYTPGSSSQTKIITTHKNSLTNSRSRESPTAQTLLHHHQKHKTKWLAQTKSPDPRPQHYHFLPSQGRPSSKTSPRSEPEKGKPCQKILPTNERSTVCLFWLPRAGLIPHQGEQYSGELVVGVLIKKKQERRERKRVLHLKTGNAAIETPAPHRSVRSEGRGGGHRPKSGSRRGWLPEHLIPIHPGHAHGEGGEWRG